MVNSESSEIEDGKTDTNGLIEMVLNSPDIFTGRIMKPDRSGRLYTLTAYNNEEIIREEHLNPSYAGRRKHEYKRQGYKVDLIEESNLTGEVIRKPDVVPDYILHKVSDQPRPDLSDIPLPKIHRKDEFSSIKEARTQKEGYKKRVKKVRESIKVYDKASGKLVFAGDFGNATDFIKYKTDHDGWTPQDWVIYVPQEIYDEIRRRLAAREAANA